MKTYFVDAFTNKRFKGNPAAVCIAASDLPDTTMQDIATEIGFSETAFIRHISGQCYNIRFFTPKQEIPLCGHATLAASKILFDIHAHDRISFLNCEEVELKIQRFDEKIAMQFPVYNTVPIDVPSGVLAALGIGNTVTTRFSPKNKIILLEIAGTALLADLKPDFNALVKSYNGINGVLVTAKSDQSDFDFHYRYFWPWAGTNEDPVTGGVQTFLTPFWVERLNKTRLKAFQSSQRTGMMSTELQEDKVLIFGEAVVVFEGELKSED
ncbi:PhzF family phenazine biosynthesis isomerase [Segetibacter sp. 3557_3]|uniref:PhzF family phenazine biosynthesis protein n=1 Tax=Segetibacter sp. 3557_3 TaxID=2547429 RepID=UPI0010591474|nr:PhzF family phenazine biosynthesis isomerase [Segetibacter sp. 3557_3]TDH29089.1 PhzF family phenazine biosynthesis isomerase [Segetibacter sp. 3557_3]